MQYNTSLTENTQKVFCPACFHTLTGGDYFCPFCGKQIKEKPIDVSVMKQISVYAVSIFLPPAGLWPAYKYVTSVDPHAKKIGIICIVLTILSLIASFYFLSTLMASVNSQINSQMDNAMFGI